MKRRRGFTLTELTTVLVVIGLLASMTLLAVGGVWKRTRITVCAMALHDVHAALWNYAAQHRNQFPPFAFSDAKGDLPRSGHWLGQGQTPELGRVGMQNVNLGALTAEKMFPPEKLVCPAFKKFLGVEGLFPDTSRWSSFGMRFPPSAELFTDAPELAYRGSPAALLGIYAQAGGGYAVPVNTYRRTVPLVQSTRQYPLEYHFGTKSKSYIPWDSALASDTFWRLGPSGGTVWALKTAVKNTWSHDRSFNVLFGTGAVHTIDDDGTVALHTAGENDQPPPADGVQYAKNGERIWQFFETARYNLETPVTTRPAGASDANGEHP